MSIRIRDLSANNASIRHLMRTQSELYKTQTQISTGKISQTYSGISTQSQRLVNTENTRTLLEKYQQDNVTTNFRLDGLETTTDAINGSINNFYASLQDFKLTGGTDPDRIQEIQLEAFKGLQDLEGYFNTQLDGRYIYSGGRSTTPSVDFGLTTLSDFQTRYDGIGTTYPTTRDAHLDDFDLTATNWLTFLEDSGAGSSRITATSSVFGNLHVGATIDVTGTAGNNGTYTIEAIDPGGTWVEVKTEMFTTEGANGAATLAAADGTPVTITSLTFDRATSTMTAVPGGALDSATTGLEVGTTFTTGGSGVAPPNDGTYTIVSNDGTNIVIEERRLTTQGVAENGTIATTSYYKGDQQTAEVRVSQSRSVEFDLTAINPEFEKAIRAMHHVMQGVTGTEGGLDQNTARTDEALYLLGSALGKNPTGAPPFGAEQTANLDDRLRDISFTRLVVQRADVSLVETINFLKDQEESIENIDQTEAITKLLDLTQSLEAAYQAFAKVRELSLSNYLS